MIPARVVVVGGSGNFGARICRRLAAEPGIHVIATGRQARNRPDDHRTFALLDTAATSFAAELAALQPAIVIHCAGPFQGQDYRVAGAALDCGAHYLDLADGRDFVTRFHSSLDRAAHKARCVAIAGASTLPGLSSAVVDHLLPRFSRLLSIDLAIAPGQRAPRGTATMAAVLGYAGRSFAASHSRSDAGCRPPVMYRTWRCSPPATPRCGQ
jgi:saccharopine dehydrogenase-like NADP-dependent oxidoreductase